MNPEVQKRTVKKPITFYSIGLALFALLMLTVAGQATYAVLSSDRIYNGVAVSGLSVGNMNKTEAAELIRKNFQDKADSTEIVLKAGSKSEKINFRDINVSYNTGEVVDRAFGVGRTGNIAKRLFDILKTGKQGVDIPLYVTYDQRKLDAIIKRLYDNTLINVKDLDVLIQENKVTVRSGHHGENIDKAAVTEKVVGMINSCTGGEVDIPVAVTQPGKIDIDELYSQINAEPVNASFEVVNNAVKLIPQVPGRKIDKAALASIIEDLQKRENTEAVLPVSFLEPEITTEKANSMIFRDTLYTASSQFSNANENEKNRAENIKLAVNKINGLILAPGEVFSFNKTVGPRTEEGGYQAAHTYVAGKVVDGIGGGICQVSSTLYNAALYSDLEIVERRNHMFTVGYVPFGQDATVSYGDIDFKFKNSTRWPIKLEAWITGANKVYFAIKGTNETPGKVVEYTPKTVKTIDYKVKYTDDPNLPEGKTEVKQKGAKGYVIDTYKTVKQDGKVISNTRIYTSTYQPLDEEILRGTRKPADPVKQPAAKTPVTHVTGVDDADNPPAPAEKPSVNEGGKPSDKPSGKPADKPAN